MRLLLIISQYSPSQTPNTLRWVPLVEAFRDKGIEVSILTTKHSGCPDQAGANGSTIYRVGHNTLLDRCYNLLGRKQRRDVVQSAGTGGGLLRTVIEAVVSKTWRKHYWPDGSKLFLKPGVQKGLELIEQQSITHIISVGLPFTCHWIAKQLKDAYPKLHWHMDIQDPFCYSKEFWVNNFVKYETKNREAEHQAFELADSISVTNPRAQEKYLDCFPFASSKLKVIPPLLDVSVSKGKYNMLLAGDKVHLGYFGSFYTAVRSPRRFLDFLKFILETNPSLLDKIQFHFVGQLDRGAAATFDEYPELRTYIVKHGFKNRGATLDAMSQVDILLNFGNTTDYHLPSKVVDYLYINKPIVNFSSIEQDTTKLFFEDKAELIDLRLEPASFEKQLRAFEAFVLTEWSPTELAAEALLPYSTEVIAEEYISLSRQLRQRPTK